MSTRPIFVATHPRSCSTAFERVFMTRKDTLACVHEPFGDAFYWGPERLSERFENDKAAREQSGFANTTYKNVLDRICESGRDGKRIFIKDIAYYLLPPDGKLAKIAPSLQHDVAGGKEETNPTVIPTETLRKFHFTFLIRHPRRAIPSYYRCTVPPLNKVTGFHHFMPNEAGYDELRRLFDYLRKTKIIGPAKAGDSTVNGNSNGNGNDLNGVGDEEKSITITVVDADDLLDKPHEVIEVYCKEAGLEFTPDMLSWEGEDAQKQAEEAFEKWNGFHNDAIGSSSFKPRSKAHKAPPSVESENEEWKAKFGEGAQKVIRDTVDANIAHYEYLKSFAIKV